MIHRERDGVTPDKSIAPTLHGANRDFIRSKVPLYTEQSTFPQQRFQMDLYYDGECFIYTDGVSKFIVHPNYKMKISRELVAHVNFITATRVKDPAEFTLPKYRKI